MNRGFLKVIEVKISAELHIHGNLKIDDNYNNYIKKASFRQKMKDVFIFPEYLIFHIFSCISDLLYLRESIQSE